VSTLESLVATTARPHVERYRSELYPISNSCTARYADMDPNAHLNNLALESLHEDARAVLTRQAFPDTHDPAGRKQRLVTSQSVVHFLAEAYWPATIDTCVGVGRIGRTSFVVSSALFHAGSCISLCDAVMVAVGKDGPVSMPAVARRTLENLRLRVRVVGS